MYLHIGGQKMIDIRRIVAMFKAHPRKMNKSNPLRQYYRPLVLRHGRRADSLLHRNGGMHLRFAHYAGNDYRAVQATVFVKRARAAIVN